MSYLWKKRNGMAKSLLALAAFMTFFMLNPLTARAYIQTQGTVVADSAVIRQEANINSNVIASIMKGDTVTINNEETDSSGTLWYKVFVDANTLGYVRGDLIQKSGDSAPVSNPVTSTTTTTVTPDTTLSAPGDSAGGTDAGASGVNQNLTIGANTVVTPIQSQGATVTSDNVRVRADASTNASIVTTVRNATAITLTGQAAGDDGKTWFQVSFIADGSEVTGFIREDFVQHTEDIVVLDEQPPVDDTVLPEEPAEDGFIEEPIFNTDYELLFESYEDEEYDWWLHNNIDNKRNRLSEILDAAEGNKEAIENANAQLKRDKVIIIILAIILVFLALTVTLLLFRLRDTYYDDFDEFDDEPEEPVRNAVRTPRTVKPVQGERPAPRPSGGQNRPAGAQNRPAGNRPVNSGERPAGNRPVSGGGRPAGNGQSRPVNGGERPAGTQNRPAGNGQSRPAGTQNRPAGNGQSHPANAQSRPAGQQQARPSSGAQPARQDAGWKAKNFMTEDDDMEFEFLNWDGEER